MAYAPIGAVEPEINQALELFGSKRRLNEQNFYQFLDDRERQLRQSLKLSAIHKQRKLSDPKKKRPREPDQPRPDDPKEPDYKRPKSMPGGYKSYDATQQCVQIEPINLRRAGKKPFSIRGVELENKYQFEEYYSTVRSTVRNSRSFTTLFDGQTRLLDDSLGVASHCQYNNSATDPTHFNSAEQIVRYFLSNGYVLPTYSATVANDLCTDPKDSNMYFVLDNQKLKLQIKNISEDSTPVYLSLYMVQATKDIRILDATVASVYANNIDLQIANGFNRAYTSNQVLGNTTAHAVGVSWKSNQFCKDKLKVIATRKICLAHGQVAHLDVFLNTKQCLSSKFLQKANLGGIVAGELQYNPIVCKKGEMFMLYDQVGCIAPINSFAGMAPEPTRIGIHAIKTYHVSKFNNQNGEVTRSNERNLTVSTVDADVDITHVA